MTGLVPQPGEAPGASVTVTVSVTLTVSAPLVAVAMTAAGCVMAVVPVCVRASVRVVHGDDLPTRGQSGAVRGAAGQRGTPFAIMCI